MGAALQIPCGGGGARRRRPEGEAAAVVAWPDLGLGIGGGRAATPSPPRDGLLRPHHMGAGAAAPVMAAATSSPKGDSIVGIWGGGFWDPTQIFDGEDPVDGELCVTGQPVKTVLRSRSWRMMAALIGVVTLSKASSLLSTSLHSASWGCAAAGENRAPTPVLAGDGGVTRGYLLEL